jgi:hypothetical protein
LQEAVIAEDDVGKLLSALQSQSLKFEINLPCFFLFLFFSFFLFVSLLLFAGTKLLFPPDSTEADISITGNCPNTMANEHLPQHDLPKEPAVTGFQQMVLDSDSKGLDDPDGTRYDKGDMSRMGKAQQFKVIYMLRNAYLSVLLIFLRRGIYGPWRLSAFPRCYRLLGNILCCKQSSLKNPFLCMH